MQKILPILAIALLAFSPTNYFDNTPQTLPFTQYWNNPALITTNDNWSGVSGIEGYLGQDIATGTGVDPQTLLTTSVVSNDLTVLANQNNTTITNGDVAEFDGIANPTIALQGSGTADAPYVLLHINTTGQSNLLVEYTLRDIDGSADNATQPVALHYRVGNTGNFTNIASAYVADATTGPNLAVMETRISAQLPGACDNQPLVQLRIMTTNAVGSDEWVGVDSISVTLNTGNSSPFVSTSAGNTQYLAGNPPVVIDPSVTVTDSDNPTLASGLVSITTNFQSGQDVLAFTGSGSTGNIIGNYNSGTGVLTLSSAGQTATLANWQNAFRSITYNNTASFPAINTSNRTVSFSVNDGTASSGNATKVVTVAHGNLSIHAVQGSSTSSPYLGSAVNVTGIVTALKSNGFFLQDPNPDADPNTSEGIFVFTGGAPPGSAAVGNNVAVTGTVAEFSPSNDPNAPPLTEITSPTIVVNSTGNSLPLPVTLTTLEVPPSGSVTQLEKFEGMRVTIPSITVVGPTEGTLLESNGTATSTGYFYGVVTGTPRPFREPGVQLPDPLPGGSPVNVPRWDGNSEIIGVDTRAQSGGTLLDVNVGAVVTGVTGPLDMRGHYYTIDADPVPAPGVSNNSLTFTSVPASTSTTVSIATLNLQRFYDETNDPSTGDVVMNNAAFNNRLNKASLSIRNVLNLPDIIGVVEVENLTTLQAIATKVNNDEVAAAQPNPNYQPYLIEGNDGTGIDIGFLVKSVKVSVVTVTQSGKTAQYTDPISGNPATLNDRPPLILKAVFTKPGCATGTTFTVIHNHLLSLSDISDATIGTRVRAKRRAQAEYLADLLQTRQDDDPNEKIISIGDYNAFEFNDGYVDVMGTIIGSPAPADQVVLSSSDMVSPNLSNLTTSLPASQRYTYTITGSACALDHILTTQNVVAEVSAYMIARQSADFYEVSRNNASSAVRVSDHDVPVVYLNFACPAASAPNHYFRTKQNGNWNDIATWESSADNVNWINATLTPDLNSVSIRVRSPHAINVTANVTVANLTLDPGCTVTTNTGVNFTVQ